MLDNINILITRKEIEDRTKELAREIEKDFKGKDLVCIGLLKGSVLFLCDLVKEIQLPLQIDFMSVSSYGIETISKGVVKILKDTDLDIKDKDILIVEDIIDTGITLDYVKNLIRIKGAKSVKCASLLDKPERRKVNIEADYIGFKVPDKFVIGYGLDYDQLYRNLPYIGTIE